MRQLVLIAHNVRSAHNIGALLRTADGLGVLTVYLTGYSPYPAIKHDARLPHITRKLHNQIAKTALGAEKTIAIKHAKAVTKIIGKLKHDGYTVGALEQTKGAILLPDFKPPDKLAIIVGREVDGLEPDVIKAADVVLQIPMLGRKESFNVSVAAAIALYHMRFN